MRNVAEHYRHAVAWLRDLAAAQEIVDHSDAFFADHVVGALADDLETIGGRPAAPPPPKGPPSRPVVCVSSTGVSSPPSAPS